MKKFVVFLSVLGVIIILISIHSFVVYNLSNDIKEISDSIYSELKEEDWEDIREDVSDIKEKWRSRRLWFALTLNNDKLEQIETAIDQCEKFAEYEEKADFIDKISTLYAIVKQTPAKEGLRAENLF